MGPKSILERNKKGPSLFIGLPFVPKYLQQNSGLTLMPMLALVIFLLLILSPIRTVWDKVSVDQVKIFEPT
jgi:hypothetical protein